MLETIERKCTITQQTLYIESLTSFNIAAFFSVQATCPHLLKFLQPSYGSYGFFLAEIYQFN
jgi:hypothetical protein